MSNAMVNVRIDTATAFLPAAMHKHGAIDLTQLAAVAKKAIDDSEKSLAAAQTIADGGWITRFLNSGEMQRHVIQSISHIRDISKVNLGLSAICNDLAAANLEHAARIDRNHHETNQQIVGVERLTQELLDHLRRPREPGMLDSLLPALALANPSDHDEVRGWLKNLTEAIDQQYKSMLGEVEELSTNHGRSTQTMNGFGISLADLRGVIDESKTEMLSQIELLSNKLKSTNADLASVGAKQSQLSMRVDDGFAESLRRSEGTNAALRKSHESLANALTTLNQLQARHKVELTEAIHVEGKNRHAMQHTLTATLNSRDRAMQATIGDLNTRFQRKLQWAVGGILIVQILGFGFLSLKMGWLT